MLEVTMGVFFVVGLAGLSTFAFFASQAGKLGFSVSEYKLHNAIIEIYKAQSYKYGTPEKNYEEITKITDSVLFDLYNKD